MYNYLIIKTMKTKLILLSLLFLFPALSDAQEQVSQPSRKSKLVSDQYNRNGLAVITITHGDQFDAMVQDAVSLIPENYDVNSLPYNTIRVDSRRSSEAALSTQAVLDLANKYDLGRAVISYIFNRKSDGTMDDSLLQERGMYNATDQDIINARASQVGIHHLAEDYNKLIKSSYVMIFDDNSIFDRTTTDSKTGKKSTTYFADATANVYLVDFDLDQLWETWIYDTDDAVTRQAKCRSFDALKVDLIPVGCVNATGTSSEGFQQAIYDSFSDAIFKLERQIDSWQVRVYVQSTHPITAKIGKKENLNNGARYRAYSYKENRKGDIISVKQGYARATDVVDNRGIATGEMEASKFYQISGGKNIQPGWLLKEQKDRRMGFSLDLAYSSVSGMIPGLSLDYLAHIGKHGASTFGLIDLGAAFNPSEEFSVNNILGSAAIGVGYQLRIARFFMLMPFVQFHALVDVNTFDEYSAYGTAGIKINFQFAYPWQIYAKAGGEYRLLFNGLDLPTTGVVLGAGIRREF